MDEKPIEPDETLPFGNNPPLPQLSAEHDGSPPTGTILRYFGDYQLIERLGQGGFGVVFKAWQSSLQRFVAVKMILAGELAGADDVARFRREAQAAASLEHPGIVPIFEIGEHEGQHYFSMGYVEGESLQQRLKDGPLPPRQAAQLVAQVAEAVAYANEKGIVHRDLKPGNILVTARQEPRITDFGLAKRVHADVAQTVTGAILGTPSYMPPEQAAGRNDQIDARSDVYALGATLYAMLSGRPPFQADNSVDTLLMVLQQEPLRLRQLNPRLPRDLETICAKCLQKDPGRRYAAAQELADDLRRWLHGEPIRARPIAAWERAWRWCRRKPALAGLAGVSALLAAVVVVGSVIWAMRESELRRYAEGQTTRALAAEAEARAANADLRRSLAERSVQAAQLAGERGKWRVALTNLDAALALNHPDPVAVRLTRIRALSALNTPEMIREIHRLRELTDIRGHEAEFAFWNGIVLWSQGKEQAGEELIHQALRGGLSPADAEFARGLLSRTTLEAAAHFQAALAADPFHYQAMSQLAACWFTLGRRQQARDLSSAGHILFPEDPTFLAFLACDAALDGDRDEALRKIKTAEQQYDAATITGLRGLAESFYQARSLELGNAGIADVGRLVAPWLQLTAFLSSRGAEVAKINAGQTVVGRAPPMAPLITRAGRDYMRLFPTCCVPSAIDLLRGNFQQQINGLQKAAAIHPEASVLLLEGMYLTIAKRFPEAETAYQAAADGTGLLPAFSHRADYCVAVTAWRRFAIEGNRAEDRNRALKYARRYLEKGMLTPAKDALLLCDILVVGKDFAKAQEVVAAGLHELPRNRELLEWQTQLALIRGQYQAAIEAAEVWHKILPKDTGATELRKVAIASLGDYLATKTAAPQASKPDK